MVVMDDFSAVAPLAPVTTGATVSGVGVGVGVGVGGVTGPAGVGEGVAIAGVVIGP